MIQVARSDRDRLSGDTRFHPDRPRDYLFACRAKIVAAPGPGC